jgi:hypothetical protein
VSQSQNNLSVVVNQQDSSGVNILNRTIGAIGYAGLVGQYTDGLLAGTGATVFTLPTTNILQFLFLNTSVAANITLNTTGATGTALIKVPPGGIVIVWNSTGASGAITAITGTADIASGTYTSFFGG